MLRRPFMPWQRMVADVIGEVDPVTGRLAYDGWTLTVPRRSGKTILVLAHATHRCTATGFFGARQKLTYTAQTRIKAVEKFREDYLADFESSPTFRRRVKPSWQTGAEHLRFENGSRFGVEANTEKAGHGGDLDVAYVDEAFAHIDGRVEQSYRPAMLTRTNAQFAVISTAGWSDGSPYLQSKVRQGRAAVAAGRTSGWAYFEWSAPDDADPGDPDTWWACMPALGHTVTEEKIRSEFETWELADFKRAYLNMWVPRAADAGWQVIAEDAWSGLADADSAVADGGRVVFSLDVSPDRSRASIAVAGRRPDGLAHVEVVANEAGTAWLAERLVGLSTRWGASVVVDERSAAGTLLPELQRERVRLMQQGTRDVVDGCGRFFDLAAPEAAGFRHRGQQVLDKAVEGATKRNVGDAWAWNRRAESIDITPLVAATGALWGLERIDGERGPTLW